MTPRDHHFSFAKQLIPGQAFRAPDRMFEELRSPQREAFLFFLWNEAGKAVKEPLPHVDVMEGPGGPRMAKLDVVGALTRGGVEVVVISMPPAKHPNEAAFLALVRRTGGEVSVFTYERCRDQAGTAVHPSDAVLAEIRPGGTRLNHGFKTGLGLADFTRELGEVLGVSLDGLEGSLPPVTVADFVARGGGQGSGAPRGERGKALESLLLVRAGLPLALWALGRLGLLGGIWPYINYVETAFTLVIMIMLLVWLHGVYADRRAQMPFSPGMAVGGWFIPIANFVLPWLIVRGAWKAYVGAGAGIVGAWWLCWICETAFNVLQGMQVAVAYNPDSHVWMLFMPNGGSIDLPPGLGDVIGPIWWYSGIIFTVLAFGLLWKIVRKVNGR